ncbi:hypothetical protein HYC85_001854 [Camellia sinensis]|uniref:RRP15-like protein n=1 Tax=Camellia sinensis TaxID=4442 RepID=A0A7J7I753_CAMSI|nr:hypothetical protein HYC85_001854 [Camellia sinensis]
MEAGSVQDGSMVNRITYCPRVYVSMDEEAHTQEVGKGPKKRRIGHKKGSKGKKKLKVFKGNGEKVKVDKKMQKLFRKRVRDYNSDDDDEEEPSPVTRDRNYQPRYKNELLMENLRMRKERNIRMMAWKMKRLKMKMPGITKFMEGCKAFRMAFKKIVKKNVSDDLLGPVLSAHKKLLAEKLAEEDAERKVKGEAKKEKHLVGEKGHVKPANFLDSHEKFLIGVATKGVVKLFNAVNKAQTAQKGLNPSRFKDAKAIRKRRKDAFFSELGKTSSQAPGTLTMASTSTGTVDGEAPSWAPLQDGYMLTNPKLKNWDKMHETTVAD